MRGHVGRVIGQLTVAMMVAALMVAPSAPASGLPASLDAGGPAAATGRPAHYPRARTTPRNARVQAIVELAGDPVTVADANTGLTMSAAQKSQLQATLQRQQTAVSARVIAAGGTVQGRYQLVYNGLLVSIAADRLASLQAVSGVTALHRVTQLTLDNTRSIPFVGTPQVWSGVGGGAGLHGEGIKIGIIDTGLDYTHADFGGPGTPAAYQTALASDTAPPDPTLVGCATCRVKGGTDLVGDNYNGTNTPVSDSNPLDCNSHGTHVAGTAAGSGVLSDGTTYTGAYDSNTIASHIWNVGPGAAPKADIYSIRVFGCSGSTSSAVIMSALEWASNNAMQVVNLSLGAPYGGNLDPEEVAINNLAKAGTIVVAAAGNSGPNLYLTGSPGSSTAAISVAASVPQLFTNIALSTGGTVTAVEANDISPASLTSLPVVVLSDGQGGISLGCSPSDYTSPSVVGALVVAQRGNCARVQRAVYGQQAGAAAVVLVNNIAGYPPYESEITIDPSTNQPYHVTIPFLGVQQTDGATLLNASSAGATATQFADTAPTDALANFSSGGPRSGDSALKPDVTAPGVNVASAGMGTGTGEFGFSGTSMASPLTAGLAALVRQAHPTWKKVQYWKAAIVNTASADQVTGYQTRTAGAGLIQAQPSVATKVVALGDSGTATLSYGFAELGQDYQATHNVTLRNFDKAPVTFTVGTAHDSGPQHSITAAPSIIVPAHSSVVVPVQLAMLATAAGDSSLFGDVAGLVTLTPQSGANNNVTLSVPYYLVPRAASTIKTRLNTKTLKSNGTAPATTTNTSGVVAGKADWYAWGLFKAKDTWTPEIDLRAVGAQVSGSTVSFAISTYGRWSNPATDEFDVAVDVNGDGVDDYIVVSADQGLMSGNPVNGVAATAVFPANGASGSFTPLLTEAPLNNATMALRVPLSLLCFGGEPCLSSGDGRIRYHVTSFARDGSVDRSLSSAAFNTVTPSLSVGMLDTVPPGGSVPETATYNATEFAQTPALGFMIVSHDNQSINGGQAQLISLY